MVSSDVMPVSLTRQGVQQHSEAFITKPHALSNKAQPVIAGIGHSSLF